MRRLLCVLLVALTAMILAATVGAETSDGTFIIRCTPNHDRAADPIAYPGVYPSPHLHTFTGNTTTNENSTYSSMVAGGSSCKDPQDTAGYWFPSLEKPDGTVVEPRFSFAYYKTIPTTYRTTQPFPADFKMLTKASRPGTTFFWDCFSGSPTGSFTTSIPYCASGDLQVRIKFPNCWDGVSLDSADHMSHVVFPTSNACPADHPVKLPLINFFVRWPPGSGGPGWHLSDGTVAFHADYWNTWQQSALEALVTRCLNAGINCGQVTG